MADPFLGEIRMMSFGFAPPGWAQCLGQTIAIQQNQALFALIGTTYGGDGKTTFALPDFSGRVPLHVSASHGLGQEGGEDQHLLTAPEMPTHTHSVAVAPANPPSQQPSADAFLSNSAPVSIWGDSPPRMTMDPAMIGAAGGGQPHENRMPFLTLGFCIALKGIFPTAN